MDNPKILYKYASRSRPDKFFSILDNVIFLARHPNYTILATLDLDDDTMTTPEIRDRINSYPQVKAYYGTSKGKIDAINRDMGFAEDWDIGIVLADDMPWHLEGFDLKIIEIFAEHFPDFDGFLHLPDGIVNEKLPTMCIIGRKLYDYFGYFYNPIYWSVACDNEQFDVVRILGKYVYKPLFMFKHMHFIWGLAPVDALYLRNENAEAYAKDLQIYRERKAINFGLPQ